MLSKKEQFRKTIAGINYWQDGKNFPHTIFYRQSAQVIGIYSVTEADESGILFVNKDYPIQIKLIP